MQLEEGQQQPAGASSSSSSSSAAAPKGNGRRYSVMPFAAPAELPTNPQDVVNQLAARRPTLMALSAASTILLMEEGRVFTRYFTKPDGSYGQGASATVRAASCGPRIGRCDLLVCSRIEFGSAQSARGAESSHRYFQCVLHARNTWLRLGCALCRSYLLTIFVVFLLALVSQQWASKQGAQDRRSPTMRLTLTVSPDLCPLTHSTLSRPIWSC